MKLAVMQPYFFPYLGYFQLIESVDKFVFYDDVNYIKGGWINRNKLLLGTNTAYFTVPLLKASSFKTITETRINQNLFKSWKVKFFKTLEQHYSKAPYFDNASELIKKVLDIPVDTIDSLAANSVLEILNYLDTSKEIYFSSQRYHNKDLKGQNRILDICKKENASEYINLIGGMSLYQKNKFLGVDVNLKFLEPIFPAYSQNSMEFVSGLSIIDVVMFNSKDDVLKFLIYYKLL